MRRDERSPRVVFFGNSHSQFSNRFFQALLDSPGELVAVVDSPAKKRGSTNPLAGGKDDLRHQVEHLGVPLLEPDNPNEVDFVAALQTLRPDLFIAVGYTNILKAPVLQVSRCLAANFHASLLPAYRGKHPVFWCLRNGERWSGLTVHVMDEGIDTGDILYQVKVRTRKNDNVGSLYERIIERSLPLVACLVEESGRGVIRRHPQEPAGVSYYSSVKEDNLRIEWSSPAETIRRWISASPGECFVFAGKERIYFLDADVVRIPEGVPGGVICEIGSKRGVIAAGDGGLRVRRLRLQDGETLSFRRWCNRAGLRIGMNINA